MAEIEEKVFHYFRKFSPKLRMMVTNEMEPADRCRLTRCSKMCNKKAKASKNYIYGLKIWFGRDDYEIELTHGNNETTNDGYILQFGGSSERKFKKYTNRRHETLWEIELDSETDVAQLAFEEFKNILQSYQKSIKKLTILFFPPISLIKNRRSLDFGIKSLDNLDHLFIGGFIVVRKMLSKLRKPLKTLDIDRHYNSNIKLHEAIYQVQEKFTWFDAKLDNQQFLKLSAKKIRISIGQLTEREIFHYIRSWQNGTIGKNIESYFWSLVKLDINKNKLLKLLRIRDYDYDGREWLEIKHFKESGKHAKLCITERSISFDVTQ